MADSSPKTPAETPTNDQQGLRRSSRSNRGQLSQNRFLLQHYVVGEEAARPIHGPGRRRAIAKPEADDDDESGPLAQSAPTASSNTRRPRMQSRSNNFANLGSHEETPAGSTGAVALYQTMGQQQIPSLVMSVQPGQMAPPQHFEQQTQESVSDAPGFFVNPADLMLDTQDLVNPQTNNIPKYEIPQFAELVDSYNKIHEERRVQEARDRLAAQEGKDKAKAAEAEEMS
ncbi:hypothetical protein LZL87_003928 [Fusarium oxysporum]|nr:hypothetical protein LZL87_003928 [Fusarium oxysporum]